MVNQSPLQFILSDKESLAQYQQGKYVTFDDIKRRLFLKAREQKKSIPDHYYRLSIEYAFKDIKSICDIFSVALPQFAQAYLYDIDDSLFIHTNKQNEVQELFPFFPPLFLQCLYLHGKIHTSLESDAIPTFFRDILLPNTKYTCIPKAKVAQLDFFIEQQGGLHDLHMHLNGSLETDQVWQDFLRSPDKIYKELKSAYKQEKVKEQLEQESELLQADSFKSLLTIARNLRVFFFDFIHNSKHLAKFNKTTLLSQIQRPEGDFKGSYLHPFQELISKDADYKHLMTVEALMYILILQEIRKHNYELLASMFHYYLLILGLTNRLLVQQTHQNGFEQFQKHTLNGLRTHSERKYLRRYYQLNGNEHRFIHFLEGRFSPKKEEKDTRQLIDDIYSGWEDLIITLRNEQNQERSILPAPILKLTAHFIKKPEKLITDDYIRHKSLRFDTWRKGKSLAALITNHTTYRERVVAVDAAASEFDAPPEVFAPTFRLMRRSGIRHFTYHAGEDFFHILSGLRAIYEAITFCDLRNGDRIGHATASGLSVKLWLNEVGNKLFIRQGEHLDNLTFVHHLIVEYKLEHLHKFIPFIVNKIQNLTYAIYNTHQSIDVIICAWKLRKCCPSHILEKNFSEITAELRSEDEWRFSVKANLNDYYHAENSTVLDLLRKYHSRSSRPAYEKIIEIDPLEIFSAEDIEQLQLGLLAEMNHREIVIETLPTSNIRIGFHKSYNSYHLWNWLKWKGEGKSIPPIVVGSDDAGIFATNIYNEYANIYCMLLTHYRMPHSQIMSIIKQLDEDSRIYRFE